MKNKGFTLIELMIAVALVGVTTVAGYSFYLNTFKFQRLQERQKDMQIRLQLGMDFLINDIRAAGFGVMDPTNTGAEKGSVACAGVLRGATSTLGCTVGVNPAVTPGNSATSTDTIMLAERNLFVGTLGISTNPLGPNLKNTINVIPPGGATTPSVINKGDLITIGGIFSSVVNEVGASGPFGNPITIATPLQAKDSYSAGTDLYTVAKILYSIVQVEGNEPGLMRSVNGGNPVLIATGIEDLQIAYYLTVKQQNEPVIPVTDTPPPANTAFLAVRVSLIARTPDPDPKFEAGFRPPLEDHPIGHKDNFRRLVLTRVVELVNDGCNLDDRVC